MIWVGTSGFQYPEWKGKFYPEKFSPKKMLSFYAERFNTTEINYTFRRMPSETTLANWSAETPERFRFTLKAPQQITHFNQLRECESLVQHFTDVAQTLGPKLGTILFQLPPSLPHDGALLSDFLDSLPPKTNAAFEFRHESWFNDDTFSMLRSHNAALCVADSEKLHAPLVVTANFGYFRLRDEGYRSADIARWATQIKQTSSKIEDTYVYFKHEESGIGPEFARKLIAAMS
ncbi:MAG TPA: DUF72 domain-containing protein [Candidatus Limnocylindria bacterium]|nr:DUF72 domain-containing protein [Candidatus Limnocylindria bacterium]